MTKDKSVDAREGILRVAHRMLLEVGPDGLRLQEIAKEVGVSHPAILHHFGSRAGLVHAVVERAMQGMERDVIAGLARSASAADVDPVEPIATSFRVLREEGHARLIAWLSLSKYEGSTEASKIGQIAELVHSIRKTKLESRGLPCPPFEDSAFTVMLASFALLGDAICGDGMRKSTVLGPLDPDGTKFRRWMADRLFDHLTGGEDIPRKKSDPPAAAAPAKKAPKPRAKIKTPRPALRRPSSPSRPASRSKH